jgi:ssDNA-binding Zn-finger/Zn-ribbon topoisomerase 1
MIGSSFFRSNNDKCPQCGNFGVPTEDDGTELDVQANTCPTCDARWNKFVILQDGQDIEFKNN